MKIQKLNNGFKSIHPSFGLKIKDNVTADIIEQYKEYGAKDLEIAYYLRTLKNSAPDEFTLVSNTNTSSSSFTPFNGTNLHMHSNMRIQKNNGEYVDVKYSYIYPYSDPTNLKAREQFNYNAENKVFFVEHLLKTIQMGINKLKSNKINNIQSDVIQDEPQDMSKYQEILKLADKWPNVGYGKF